MRWSAELQKEIALEFIAAQGPLVARLYEFRAAGSGRHDAAERERSRLRQVERHRATMRNRRPIQCANLRCGFEFVPYRATTKYCSDLCRVRERSRRAHHARRARTLNERMAACAFCQGVFARWRSDELYCSDECCDAEHYRRKLERMRVKRARRSPGLCANPHCRLVFVKCKARLRYCSKVCQRVGATLRQRHYRALLRRLGGTEAA